MAFVRLSPAVDVKETDLTLIVPAVATSIAGFTGPFQWGPVDEVNSVDSEQSLINLYGKPNNDVAKYFLTASNFLSYSNHIKLNRVIGALAKNAYTGGAVAPLIKNEDHYLSAVTSLTSVKWVAKYPGVLGNSLKISIADSATFATWAYRDLFGSSITLNKNITTVVGTSVTVDSTANLSVGMMVTAVGVPANAKISSITNATTFVLSAAATAAGTVAATFTTYTGTPGTSSYVAAQGGSNDEVHVVVVDEDGLWTGTAGTVLERYASLSKASDAKDYSGVTSYYANVLNRASRYVWFGGTHEDVSFGTTSASNFASLSAAVTYSLAGGVDANGTADITSAVLINGYAPFQKAEEIDVNFIIGPCLNDLTNQSVVANYIINNITTYRRDCVAFISPNADAVVNNTNNEIQGILNFRNTLNSNSYSMMDSGWKLMYNRYQDTYVWVPMCSDLAGLCALTDDVADPWFSPGGFNRGFVKNVVKLAFNPGSQTIRDTLYVNNVNPVASFKGEGVVLFGDKTLQQKPSAFDRINVRRLFIILEKAIATASKYMLFEFNDAFTRARFVAMVTPYLREVQGRRGIVDFRVRCDSSNNTPQVIDSNGFRGDIFIKPPRSINFIELGFIATPTGVNFEEVM